MRWQDWAWASILFLCVFINAFRKNGTLYMTSSGTIETKAWENITQIITIWNEHFSQPFDRNKCVKMLLTVNSQINKSTLIFTTIIGCCTSIIAGMITRYTLQYKWPSWYYNAPRYVLIDQLTLESNSKS